MESLLGPLLPLYDRERAAGRAVALGLLVETAGSTYRKPGALMLIAANGDSAGLLSGGCLEGDLAEYARTVIDTGKARVVSYDMRGGDDLVWGLGLGCEGAMHILLLRVGPQNAWQPLAHLAQALARHEQTAVGIVIASELNDSPTGTVVLHGTAEVAAVLASAADCGRIGWFEADSPRWKMMALPLGLPPKILLLGAGPDAAPVVDFAARLNWKVTLVDHRPAYADGSHFPQAERVLHGQPEELLGTVDPAAFSAAVVMSHHLPSDLKYLRALSATPIPYIGLLGPAARRERLLADLGADAERIRGRLYAPVGLAIGGRSPESIALAIIAEIHAFVHAGAARAQGAQLPLHPATPVIA
ncbi:MAG: XdhC family protein [Proteobacteria bacterium]|nr:XdhC family protein [Pseudomonadota bacterium]